MVFYQYLGSLKVLLMLLISKSKLSIWAKYKNLMNNFMLETTKFWFDPNPTLEKNRACIDLFWKYIFGSEQNTRIRIRHPDKWSFENHNTCSHGQIFECLRLIQITDCNKNYSCSWWWTMVFILDGCSFHYAHTWSKSGFSICWRHLVTSKKSSNPIFFRKKTLFSSFVRNVKWATI